MNEIVNKEVLDRIKKLLDHHAGCLKINSEAEAMTALELAKELMKKHHLDMMMLNEQNEVDNDITHKKMDKCSVYVIPIWLTNIINIVNNLCNCSCILEKTPQPNGYIHTNVVFVSEKSEIDRVFEMYMFFKKTTYKLANLHVKRICGNYTNWRSFAEGFTSRLLERSRIVVDENKKEDDVQDVVESTSDDFDFVDEEENVNCTDIVVVDQDKNYQLTQYLKNVRIKIEKYIEDNISNVKEEEIKKSSKVLMSSYEFGRKQAEKQAMSFVDKNHQLKNQKTKTRK